MRDQTVRALERRFKETGSADDEARYLRACLSASELALERLELAAFLGHGPAVEVVGSSGDRLPTHLLAADVDLGHLLPPPSAAVNLGASARTLDADLSLLLRVGGHLSGPNAWHFSALLAVLCDVGPPRLVVDLAGVRHLNSTALGMLMQTAEEQRRAGGLLALLNLPPRVRLVLEMLGLLDHFRSCRRLDEAFEDALPEPSGAPVPQHLGLARWGLEACVRAALAQASSEDDPAWRAAAGWLEEPSPTLREAAREAISHSADPAARLAAETVVGGAWALGLRRPDPSKEPTLDPERTRSALVPWALGYRS